MHKFDLTEINRIGAEIKYSEKRDQKKLQIMKEKILEVLSSDMVPISGRNN